MFPEFKTESLEQAWQDEVARVLKGKDFTKTLCTETVEGITLQPIYSQGNAAGEGDASQRIPGAAVPFLNFEIAAREPRAMNAAAQQALKSGQNAIFFKHFSPADSASIEAILKDIDLNRVSLFASGNRSTLNSAWLLIEWGQRMGIAPEKLTGGLGFDPLGHLVSDGHAPSDSSVFFNEMAALFEWATAKTPHFKVVEVDAGIYHDAGAHAVQELAFAMATGINYLDEAIERRNRLEDVLQHMWFSFSIGSSFFTEIAKLRAARLLWSRICAAFDEKAASAPMTIHARTSRFNKAKFEQHTNIVRTTTEAMAAFMGGCNSFHIDAFDCDKDGSDLGLRVARNVHAILQHESSLDKVLDPGSGSWYIEKLTSEMAEKAWTLLQDIEKKGGMLAAIEQGLPQKLIAETRSGRQEKIETRQHKIIGANAFVLPTASEKMVGEDVGSSSDGGSAGRPAEGEGLSSTQNAKTEAGSGLCVERLPAHAALETLENVRLRTTNHIQTGHKQPQVVIFTMGNIREFRAPADFATDFFRIAGFQVDATRHIKAEADVITALEKGQPEIAVLCSSVAVYQEMLPDLAASMRTAAPSACLVLAGQNNAVQTFHTCEALSAIIFPGVNVVTLLDEIMNKIGISK